MSYTKHKNVKNLFCDINNNQLTFDYHENNNENTEPKYLFLFENPMDTAFAHWIYESSILLLQYIELKEKYPNLKLLVKKNPNRKYKQLFFDALKINIDDVYYLDNKENIPHDCKTVYKDIPINNICLVSNNYQCLNSMLDTNLLTELIKNFKNTIEKNLNININIDKNNKHLFFPRNKKENFEANDRNINYSIVNNILKNEKYIEYDTMETNNFKDQIKLLLSSENIYLDWGSSFFVNGLFCKNSNIYLSHCMLR